MVAVIPTCSSLWVYLDFEGLIWHLPEIYLRFEGRILTVPEVYFRFKGLLIRRSTDTNGFDATLFRHFGGVST